MQTDELLKLREENEHLKSLLELETFSVVKEVVSYVPILS